MVRHVPSRVLSTPPQVRWKAFGFCANDPRPTLSDEKSQPVNDVFFCFFLAGFSLRSESGCHRPSAGLASSLSAWIKLSKSPCGTACALNTFLFFVCAELHHQYLAGCSPFVSASTHRTPPTAVLLLSAVSVSHRYPPNVVFQKKIVAMRANIRQGDTSHSTERRDDPPQEL